MNLHDISNIGFFSLLIKDANYLLENVVLIGIQICNGMLAEVVDYGRSILIEW
jgi:hypothetical protein